MHTKEAAALAADLVAAGLLTVDRDAEGNETWTLPAEGARVGRLLAMDRGGGEGFSTHCSAPSRRTEARRRPRVRRGWPGATKSIMLRRHDDRKALRILQKAGFSTKATADGHILVRDESGAIVGKMRRHGQAHMSLREVHRG